VTRRDEARVQGLFPVQAAIFDLDGVLVDTAKYHYLAGRGLLTSFTSSFHLRTTSG